MLSMENTISAWAWVIFSISACVAEGKLSRRCHDVSSTKVFKLQSSASLSCGLREDCLKSLGANASHIFWKMNGTQIPQQQYDFNTTVSRVTFQVVKGYLTCHINMKGVTNILHRFTIKAGLPPDKPKNISCISHWRESFTCFWDQGRETFIETNFTLFRKSKLENDTCVTLKNSCSFLFPRIYISENLTLVVKAQNALGEAESDPLFLNTWHTWKTNPPQNVIVHSVPGQSRSLLVTWHEPTVKPPTFVLVYELQYRMTGTDKWIQVTEEKKNYNTSYVIKNLKPFTNYTVAVRCIDESHFFWSDWSSLETGLTPAAKPMKGPDLWRQIINLDSPGSRKVHLLWKALNRSETNGIILGYRIQYVKRKDPTVMQRHDTTYLNYSLFLPHEAYVITVVAYNSAGDSPEATLIVPAINQTGFAAVQYVKVTPQNNLLLVQWKATRPPDNGYVIEWHLILDTSPFAGPLHWQHEDNTSEMSYLQGLEEFKRYNISVYSVYNDGPGDPFSIPAYLQQHIPEEGPTIFTPIVKGTEVTVKWNEIPVEKQRGFITNYTIFYKCVKGENAITVNSTVHEYTLKSLQKDTDYTLHVMASTEKGGMNSSIFFKTNALEPEDTAVIVVPVLVCFLLIVNVLMICFGNKHKIKNHIWPDVADPAGSTLADWFHEHQYKMDQTPKLLNPGNDFNTDFSTVEVLCLSEESKLQSARKDKDLLLHTVEVECSFTTSPSQQSTSNDEETNLLQSMNTVIYTVLEEGYKSQIPDISRSSSKQPLLSNTSEKSISDFEIDINTTVGAGENCCPQIIEENDVFQPIDKNNAYLKNSLNVTELQIASCSDNSNDPVFDSCSKVDKKVQEDARTVDLNLQSPQQDNQATNPVQTYITVELLGSMLNNEM